MKVRPKALAGITEAAMVVTLAYVVGWLYGSTGQRKSRLKFLSPKAHTENYMDSATQNLAHSPLHVTTADL